MDHATARLALQIQLDDVHAILTTRPKSSNTTEATSERAAFEALRNELSRKWTQLQGQVFASTILREENTNRIVFKKLLDEEQQAERDHDLACRLAGVPVPQRPVASKRASADPTPTLANKITTCKKRPAEDHVGPEQTCDISRKGGRAKAARVDTTVKVTTGTSSIQHTPPPPPPPPLATPSINNGVCSSCLDMHPGTDMLQLPCKDEGDKETHAYCRDCLRRLFESSITDSSHFPPRCCSKIIPLLSCMRFLSQQLISRFEARREELGTPNRTYCSNTSCSKWVPPLSIVAGIATCTACSHATCTTCKTKQDEGLCPEDKDVKKLMNVVQQKRWQTCPNCKEMVELERGCYHITCRCRHEFCYLCLAKFVKGRKTCKCRGGDEHYLVDRGGNNAPIAAATAAPAAATAPPAPHPTWPVIPAATISAPVHRAPVAAPLVPPVQPALPEPPIYAAVPPAQFSGHAPYQTFYTATPDMAPPHPHWYAHPAQPAVPTAWPMQQQQQQQRHQQQSCDHEFERLYRSEGEDTSCDWCDREDRWVNWCEYCNLHVCWFCTKHRT